MILPALLFAAATVLPSDRMAMADRMFDRGDWAGARTEYAALRGAEGVAEDELLYRLAECARALKDNAAARAHYGELIDRHPLSRHAVRARLNRALAGTEAEQRSELRLLDSDSVPAPVRATALYHLGVLNGDADAFARAAKLDPKGPYAVYARFRHAALVAENPDPAVRRQAIGELMEIARGADRDLAREAVYLAATRSYADRRHAEASLLFARFLKTWPDDARAEHARTMAAWSDYLVGKYAEAAALCGERATDDFAYLRAACAQATGDRAKAKELMTRYLEAYPDGRYRAAVERRTRTDATAPPWSCRSPAWPSTRPKGAATSPSPSRRPSGARSCRSARRTACAWRGPTRRPGGPTRRSRSTRASPAISRPPTKPPRPSSARR